VSRLAWPAILDRAGVIVESYDTGVTLRQLFYRLVSEQVIPNTTNAYKELSRQTAAARRKSEFPRLIDHGRSVVRPAFYDSPDDALAQLRRDYRRERFGIPIVALKGYSSQTLVDEVADEILDDGRPAVLLYAGDFDPTGEDVDRDFVERVAVFAAVHRIALNAEQVDEYGLPPLPGKQADSRAAAFAARHGQLMQVELDALDPDDLRSLYANAITTYWEDAVFRAVLDRERQERQTLHLPDVSGTSAT